MTYHTRSAARSEALANDMADHAIPILAALEALEKATDAAAAAGIEFRSRVNSRDEFTEDAAVWIDGWKGLIADYAKCEGGAA